ncbi:MAG: Swt1 family HEPN domain-containing protein, partial [Acidimicrobiales bacterium]
SVGQDRWFMGTSYRAQVAVAFEILAEGLAPFVDARMSATFPGDDWILMAAGKLGKRRDVLVSLSDPHFQLEVMNRWWGPAFSSGLSDGDRARVGELRTSRNHWAHPDQDHPLDIDAALSVVQNGEELLRAIGSDEAERMADLQEQLRWDSVREVALEQGLTESEAVLQQLVELKEEHDELQRQLAAAREADQSASGRSRAVSRQLAELQTQYAAVAGLRDQYLVLQRQLEEEREKREAVLGDTTTVRQQLDAAQAAISALQNQSSSLNDQLSQARRTLATIDPIDTEVGKRWLWLISALVMVLGILVVVAAYIPR